MPENNPLRTNQLITAAVLVIALAAVFFVGRSLGDDGGSGDDGGNATARTVASSTETYGIVTGGEASVTGIPDQLTFSASVTNTRDSNDAAIRATNADVRAINNAARNQGVASHDIQTQGLSVRPKYEYLRSGGTRLVGYTATQSIKYKVRNLENGGKVIGAVATAAGNDARVSGIALSISNQDDLVAQARAAAVKKSKAAAVALAEAAGSKVGRLEYVEEVVPQQNVYAQSAELAGLYRGGLDSAAAVPIRPGKKQVSVTVKVRWSLAGQ